MRNSLKDKLGALVLGASALFMNGGCASYVPKADAGYVISNDINRPPLKDCSLESFLKVKNSFQDDKVTIKEAEYIDRFREMSILEQQERMCRSGYYLFYDGASPKERFSNADICFMKYLFSKPFEVREYWHNIQKKIEEIRNKYPHVLID